MCTFKKMNEEDERENLLNEIKKTNIIPSLKAQLKMAIKDKLQSKLKKTIPRSISQESEIANNIILEFLFSCGFHSTASIFFAESSMHQLTREEILENVQVNDGPGTIAELLIAEDSKPSISVQTEFQDLSTKLAAVDDQIEKKKRDDAAFSAEEMMRKGMDEIDREYELRFNNELQHRLDVFRATELANTLASDRNRNQMELDRLKKELEADLRRKTNDERIKFDRTADGLRAKQRELEVEIGKWAEQNVINAKAGTLSLEVRQILKDADEKGQKIKSKMMIISKKLESDICKLEDEQLEHRKTKREVEKLKLSIQLIEQNSFNE